MRFTPRRFLATLLVVLSALASVEAQGPRQPFSRVSVTVTPDRADWTYRPGDPVSFRIDVLRDGHPVQGATVKYGVGPEMLPPSTEATAVVGGAPLSGRGRHDDDAGVPAARRDGRDRGAHLSWRRHGGLFARSDSADADQPAGLRRVLGRRAATVGGIAHRRAVDTVARLRHCRRQLLAGQSPERRGHRGRQPAVRHPLHAQGGGEVSGALERAGGGRAAVSRMGRDGGPRRDHAADRHPRHPGDSAARGVRQPRARRPQRLSHLRARLARALLLSSRLCGDAAGQRLPDLAAASGTVATSGSPAAARAARWPS